MEGIEAGPAPGSNGLPAIRLSYGEDAVVRDCSTPKGTILLKQEMVK